MGYYIETFSPFHKESQILFTVPSARRIARAAEADETEFPVCVVDNGLFEAAGICYDAHEVEAFNDPTDMRPKKWVAVPRAEAVRLVPELQRELDRQGITV